MGFVVCARTVTPATTVATTKCAYSAVINACRIASCTSTLARQHHRSSHAITSVGPRARGLVVNGWERRCAAHRVLVCSSGGGLGSGICTRSSGSSNRASTRRGSSGATRGSCGNDCVATRGFGRGGGSSGATRGSCGTDCVATRGIGGYGGSSGATRGDCGIDCVATRGVGGGWDGNLPDATFDDCSGIGGIDSRGVPRRSTLQRAIFLTRGAFPVRREPQHRSPHHWRTCVRGCHACTATNATLGHRIGPD